MTGVLAFQGSFALHLGALDRLGEPTRRVKRLADLDGLDRLVIPGGESTVMSQFLASEGLEEPLRERLASGRLAAFGTCAGAILLGRAPADEAATTPADATGARLEPRQPTRLGVARSIVRRNAYGRQIDSFRAPLDLAGALAADDPFEGVFIRAPRFEALPAEAEVLARHEGEPVLLREGRLLLGAFHPELTRDLRVHRYFLSL